MTGLTKEQFAKLKPEEQEAVRAILAEYQSKGDSEILKTLYEADYNEIPVDIDTFIESDEYAGWFTNNGKGVYPYWRPKLREMWNLDKNYTEIAVTGGIGTGKTHIAVLALAYGLYRLMCLKDPVRYYGLNGDILYVVFFNVTLQLSKGVAYSKFQELLQHSPWFKARGKITGTKYLEYTPNGAIRFTVGSQFEHSLGRAVILGIMDEVNFNKGSNIDFEKSKIMEVYASVLERIGSRFTVNGKVQGKLFLVSSKRAESDFIESYIRKQQGKPSIFIVDSKIWEVKPEGTYSGETFNLAVGSSNLPSMIVPDGEDPNAYEKQGYEIMKIPVELKPRFETNMELALMNVAGVSLSNVTKFLARPYVERCQIPQNNPFSANVLTIGMHDNMKYQDFLNPELVTPDVYTKPLFIHFDCSITGDQTGIGCVAVLGYTNRDGFDEFSGEKTEVRELAYREVFTIGIQCPSGSEISFRKNRELVYYLKHHLGWNIKGISLDGFQSADSKQNFITAGFEDTTIVSLDKKPEGYLCLKSAINERRIQLLSNQEELVNQLVNLEQNNQTGKVDHPIDGRKDMGDGLAGAVYNASLHDGQFAFHLVDDAKLFGDFNDVGVDERQDFVNGLVATPANAVRNRIEDKNKKPESNISDFAKDSLNGFIVF